MSVNKNYLLTIFNLFKANRRLMALIIGIIIVIFLILPKNQSRSNINPNPPASLFPDQQIPSKSFQNLTQETTLSNETSTYFVNKVFTKKPVTGYSWFRKDIVYSTPDGIYLGNNNKPLILRPINDISWSQNGYAVFKSNNHWSVFNTNDNSVTAMDINNSQASISPNSHYLSLPNDNSVTLKNLKSSQTKNIPLSPNISQFFWSADSQFLATATPEQTFIINLQDFSVKKFASSNFGGLLGISPSADYVIYALAEKINLVSINNQKQTGSINFEFGSNLTAHWINQDLFIVIETLAPDRLGRHIDNLWQITNHKSKTLLINSQPIPNRLNPNIHLYVNLENNILPLTEKNDTLWILSLIPNQFPSYTQKGFPLIPLSTQGD